MRVCQKNRIMRKYSVAKTPNPLIKAFGFQGIGGLRYATPAMTWLKRAVFRGWRVKPAMTVFFEQLQCFQIV